MEQAFSIFFGGRLDTSKCLKELYLRHFSGNFLELKEQQFFQISPEKYIR